MVILKIKHKIAEITTIGIVLTVESLKEIFANKKAVYKSMAPKIASGKAVKIKSKVSDKNNPRQISNNPSRIIEPPVLAPKAY